VVGVGGADRFPITVETPVRPSIAAAEISVIAGGVVAVVIVALIGVAYIVERNRGRAIIVIGPVVVVAAVVIVARTAVTDVGRTVIDFHVTHYRKVQTKSIAIATVVSVMAIVAVVVIVVTAMTVIIIVRTVTIASMVRIVT